MRSICVSSVFTEMWMTRIVPVRIVSETNNKHANFSRVHVAQDVWESHSISSMFRGTLLDTFFLTSFHTPFHTSTWFVYLSLAEKPVDESIHCHSARRVTPWPTDWTTPSHINGACWQRQECASTTERAVARTPVLFPSCSSPLWGLGEWMDCCMVLLKHDRTAVGLSTVDETGQFQMWLHLVHAMTPRFGRTQSRGALQPQDMKRTHQGRRSASALTDGLRHQLTFTEQFHFFFKSVLFRALFFYCVFTRRYTPSALWKSRLQSFSMHGPQWRSPSIRCRDSFLRQFVTKGWFSWSIIVLVLGVVSSPKQVRKSEPALFSLALPRNKVFPVHRLLWSDCLAVALMRWFLLYAVCSTASFLSH